MNDLISRLSELRCQYNCFDENERDSYHTLSEAINALSNDGDTISRQAAIDAVENVDWYHLNTKGEMESGANSAEHQTWYKADDIYKVLEELPSVQPEQKHGKWIVIMNEPNITFDECKCSECGVIEYFNKGWKKFSFCPNCGAKMSMERE